MNNELTNLSKTVHRNTYYNVFLRGVGIILGLLFTRYNVLYLGATLYGLWLTIASVTSWANIGNLGIAHGLRNELTKAVANNDTEKQKNLIWTAVVLLSKLSVLIFVLLTLTTEILFFSGILDSFLRVPMYITNAFFCISFVLGISRSVAFAYQLSWLSSFSQTAVIVFNILGVLFLMLTKITPNLVVYAVIMGVGTIFGNIIILYNLKNILVSHVGKKLKGHYVKENRQFILNVGLQFFVLQITCLILYSTDNVIINKLFQSAMVTKYSVIHSVFNAGESVFALVLISLWSAVTYAAEKKEYSWIKKETRNILGIWGIYVIGVIVVSLFFNEIVRIWLGQGSIFYEKGLILMFAVYTILTQFGAIYVNVANGLGRLKLQILCSVVGAIINIPLSVFLASYCNMGLKGIILATLICSFGSVVIVPIDIICFLRKRCK